MMKKRARRKNASYTYNSYRVYGSPEKTFSYLKGARVYAQSQANDKGHSIQIEKYGPGRSKSYWVYPKKAKNPKATLPRGKWISAKIRVTKSGKIQARIKR